MADTATTETSPDLQATVSNYFECWNAADDDSRAAAVARTWAEGATSTDPLAVVTGHGEIIEMMSALPVTYPGHSFRQVGEIDTHHDVVRWGWEMLDAHGTRVLDGIDVAWVDDTGRITHLAGFFGSAIPGTA